jgi:hypothetical protein
VALGDTFNRYKAQSNTSEAHSDRLWPP